MWLGLANGSKSGWTLMEWWDKEEVKVTKLRPHWVIGNYWTSDSAARRTDWGLIFGSASDFKTGNLMSKENLTPVLCLKSRPAILCSFRLYVRDPSKDSRHPACLWQCFYLNVLFSVTKSIVLTAFQLSPPVLPSSRSQHHWNRRV